MYLFLPRSWKWTLCLMCLLFVLRNTRWLNFFHFFLLPVFFAIPILCVGAGRSRVKLLKPKSLLDKSNSNTYLILLRITQLFCTCRIDWLVPLNDADDSGFSSFLHLSTFELAITKHQSSSSEQRNASNNTKNLFPGIAYRFESISTHWLKKIDHDNILTHRSSSISFSWMRKWICD